MLADSHRSSPTTPTSIEINWDNTFNGDSIDILEGALDARCNVRPEFLNTHICFRGLRASIESVHFLQNKNNN